MSNNNEFEIDETENTETIEETNELDLFSAEEESTEVLGEITEEVSSELIEGTELDGFESASIEDLEFVEDEQIESIVESILFATDKPVSLAAIIQIFKGTTAKKDKIRRALENLAVEYAGGRRGVTLEEVTGGYQLRTKIDNMNFLKRGVKTRPFKLSGPALETLAIVAYKQPVVKLEIDQIRGVESGHLLRALMEKGLVNFEGKAEQLPGKPMQYGTTRRFLEIFGLRNLKELPSLSQIDELLPEGIGEPEDVKPTLSSVTDSMSEQVTSVSYSQGEEELGIIEEQLTSISTSSDFFEQEKIRQKQKRDEEKAQNIREAVTVGEEVSKRDLNWLAKYEEALALGVAATSTLDVNHADQNLTEVVSEAEEAEFLSEELSTEEQDGLEYIEDEDAKN